MNKMKLDAAMLGEIPRLEAGVVPWSQWKKLSSG
jgi:hypothetical protein